MPMKPLSRFKTGAGWILALLLFAPAVSAQDARTITWYNGERQVTVPHTITRVASSWEAQNSVIAMLGFADTIVATTRAAKGTPAFRKLVPSIVDVPLAIGGDGGLNVEELLRLRPEVLFMSSEPPANQRAQLERGGIAIASFRANAIAAIVERVGITGEILGGQASARAREYQAYFKRNVEIVNQALAAIAPSRRVSLYHSVGSPLTTSGRPSLNQDWMDLAQVRNVAEHWTISRARTTGDVSIEQIIAADPDMIIAMRAGDVRTILNDPKWRNLRAVKTGRVYANPRGMFWWCRETSETALQFLWLATLAYPDEMAHIDIREETRQFYRRFYHYELSDAELDEFLHPGQ